MSSLHDMKAAAQNPIIGLLLAAGKSSRFVDAQGIQRDKLAAQLPNTKPPLTVIESSARALLAACPQSIAVLKADSPHQALMQRMGMNTLIAERAEQGMGESLAAGAREAMRQSTSGVLIMLADLPFVRTETIQSVVQALQDGASIVVPRFEGRHGHPVGFAAAHLPAIAALKGDAGAKALIMQNASQIRFVDSSDSGILHDIDTEEALFMLAN